MFRRFVVLFAGLLPTLAPALTVRPPSFTELVSSADSVVTGTVTQIQSVLRTVENRPVPFTLVTVKIEQTLKGPDQPTVVLQCLGGTVGSESLRVLGVPEFVVGDRGFFFIQNNGSQFFPLVGVMHGLYWTVPSEEQGGEVVTRENGDLLVSTGQISQPLEHRSRSGSRAYLASPGRGLTPGQFSELIKAEIQSHATR